MDAVGFLRLDYDTPLNDLSALQASLEECAETCNRDVTCNGFVYALASTPVNCWLKRQIAGTGRCKTGYYTYVKIGNVIGIQYVV